MGFYLRVSKTLTNTPMKTNTQAITAASDQAKAASIYLASKFEAPTEVWHPQTIADHDIAKVEGAAKCLCAALAALEIDPTEVKHLILSLRS